MFRIFLFFSLLFPIISFSQNSKISYEFKDYLDCDSVTYADGSNSRNIALPYIPQSKNPHQIEFQVKTQDSTTSLNLYLPYLNCDAVELILINEKSKTQKHIPLSSNFTQMCFPVGALSKGEYLFQLNIKSSFALFIPIRLAENDAIFKTEKTNNLLYSIYFGIILIMAFYNLFVFISTKSKSYLFYVVYILSFGIAQFFYLGYFNVHIAFLQFHLSKTLLIVFSSIAGIAGPVFYNHLLETKFHLKWLYYGLLFCAVGYGAAFLTGIFNLHYYSYHFLNVFGGLVGLLSLIGSILLTKKKVTAAPFFLFAFLFFLVGLITMAFINTGILPYNNVTKFILPAGSSIEIALLSLALANRINTLNKKNKELIETRNKFLETKVAERTAALEETNKNLKEAQAQLISSEKMASLGQLTAGIAHEINNPINFISANILPLKRDIQDYEEVVEICNNISEENVKDQLKLLASKKEELGYIKTELADLLIGIEDGAKRTAEIVKNLKIFSHIDRAQLSKYSVNEGLVSTLKLLNHKLNKIQINTRLQDVPEIECFPGKLNQVFMNLLSNSLDAVQNTNNARIDIETKYLTDKKQVYISVKDNGCGIDPKIQKDIFNPFFTTKDVGAGTGLGLSISMSIIREHHGDIFVKSELNQGAEFTIYLPEEYSEEES